MVAGGQKRLATQPPAESQPVIPGRAEGANPESRAAGQFFVWLWIPGSLAALAPRNDGGKL
jgi:hypothetical protein